MKTLSLTPVVLEILAGCWTAIKKIPWLIGYNAFLALIICLALEILAGELLFYNYAISVIIQNPVAAEDQIIFKESAYQSVLLEWKRREMSISGNSLYELPNPFE